MHSPTLPRSAATRLVRQLVLLMSLAAGLAGSAAYAASGGVTPENVALGTVSSDGGARANTASDSGASASRVAEDAPALARRVCLGCHGPGGHATSPLFPHLAGQRVDYLAAQLKAFKTRKRAERDARDYMWGIAASLDDDMVERLAKYYASQPPAAARDAPPVRAADTTLVQRGEQLFQQGDSSRSIPACANCHGERAEGRGPFPRLAGQQGSYLVRQLTAMKEGSRPNPVMEVVLESIADEQIAAVAAYLAGL